MTWSEARGVLLGTVMAAMAIAAVTMWISEPPRGPAGAVPSPRVVVQRDSAAELALCGMVTAGAATPEWLREQGRRPELRYSLALAASTGDVLQVGHSCTRAGY